MAPIIAKEYSKTIGHELEHLMVDFEGGMTVETPQALTIGSVALKTTGSIFQAYMHEPEEIRCREAEVQVPNNLIRIRYREHY